MYRCVLFVDAFKELSGYHRITAELQLYSGVLARECTEILAKNLAGDNVLRLTNAKAGKLILQTVDLARATVR